MPIPATDRTVQKTDNQPAAVAIANAKDAQANIGKFLENVPVIQTLEQARSAADHFRIGSTALKELEDERTTTPLYTEWKDLDGKVKAANKLYKAVADPLAALVKTIDNRVYAYRERERVRKRQEAEEAQRKADEARRQAEQIAFARDEALNDAEVGVSADVGQLIVDADQSEKRAAITTQIADGMVRNAEVVKIRDNLGGQAMPDRNPDVPVIADIFAVLTAMGAPEYVPPEIEQAVITASRKHYRAHGEWPAGITLVKQRSLSDE